MARIEDSKSFRGVVKGGSVAFEEGVSLPEGTPVLVTVSEAAAGSPEAVLAAMAQSPHLEDEDVIALLRSIERGKRPVRFDSVLD